MTNRKPDGWVWDSPEGEGCGDYEVIHVYREKPSGIDADGFMKQAICIVDPRLLDWVEKTKITLGEYREALCMLGHETLARGLEIVLAELREIEGEG